MSDDTKPQGAQSAPQSSEPAPRSSESAPRSSEPASRSSGSAPRSSESAPRSSKSAPRASESAPHSQEPAPRGSESAPSVQEHPPARDRTLSDGGDGGGDNAPRVEDAGWPARFFLLRPTFGVLLLVLIVLGGVMAYFSLVKESLPDLAIPQATITTSWPGADPETIEQEVTEAIEKEVQGLRGLKQVTSASFDSFSIIAVEFEAGADLSESMQLLRARVDDAEAELPAEAEKPTIEQVSVDDRPILTVTLFGNVGDGTMSRAAEEFAGPARAGAGRQRGGLGRHARGGRAGAALARPHPGAGPVADGRADGDPAGQRRPAAGRDRERGDRRDRAPVRQVPRRRGPARFAGGAAGRHGRGPDGAAGRGRRRPQDAGGRRHAVVLQLGGRRVPAGGGRVGEEVAGGRRGRGDRADHGRDRGVRREPLVAGGAGVPRHAERERADLGLAHRRVQQRLAGDAGGVRRAVPAAELARGHHRRIGRADHVPGGDGADLGAGLLAQRAGHHRHGAGAGAAGRRLHPDDGGDARGHLRGPPELRPERAADGPEVRRARVRRDDHDDPCAAAADGYRRRGGQLHPRAAG